jgi:hypothetical protein
VRRLQIRLVLDRRHLVFARCRRRCCCCRRRAHLVVDVGIGIDVGVTCSVRLVDLLLLCCCEQRLVDLVVAVVVDDHFALR